MLVDIETGEHLSKKKFDMKKLLSQGAYFSDGCGGYPGTDRSENSNCLICSGQLTFQKHKEKCFGYDGHEFHFPDDIWELIRDSENEKMNSDYKD